MLKLTAIEFLARLIPEVLVFTFASYTFSNTRIDKKKYMLSTLLLGIAVFIVRLLPINFGVHTLLTIIMMTVITCNVSKINAISGIKASIITATLLFLCEGLNVLALKIIFKDNLVNIISDPTLKTIYALPSLVLFSAIITFNYMNNSKKGRLKNA